MPAAVPCLGWAFRIVLSPEAPHHAQAYVDLRSSRTDWNVPQIHDTPETTEA